MHKNAELTKMGTILENKLVQKLKDFDHQTCNSITQLTLLISVVFMFFDTLS